MEVVKNEDDLEDGEIREEVLEDISDCSLSDIIHGDFNDDTDVNTLQTEAPISPQVDEPNNEEEKCRLEALKSLLENTGFLNDNEETMQELEDLTEEEKLRFEAVKSLLRNSNFLAAKDKESSTPLTRRHHRKRGKKRGKKKQSDSPPKRIKVKEEPTLETKPDVLYLKETTSLLSGLSEDVKKINESIENKKLIPVHNTNQADKLDTVTVPDTNLADKVNTVTEPDTNLVDKVNTVENRKSVTVPDTNLVDKVISKDNEASENEPLVVIGSTRSWYPKTEFTLWDVPLTWNTTVKRNNCDDGHIVKNQSKKLVSQKPENKSIPNLPRKTEPVSERLESDKSDASTKLPELPKQEPLDDSTAVKLQVKQSVPKKSTESKPTTKSVPEVIYNKPPQRSCDLQPTKKLKKTSHQIINSTALIRSPKSMKPTLPKKSTSCSFRKVNIVPPISNRKVYSLIRNKSDRYKLNNLPPVAFPSKKPFLNMDKSKLKLNNVKLKLNNPVKSRYSINRTNQYSKVNPKEFIIPLNDDDLDESSKEDSPAESVSSIKSLETHPVISSSLKNNEEKEMPKIKQEPLEEPEELPNDEFISKESPSTTTADTSTFIKEEPFHEAGPDEIFDVGCIKIGDVSSLSCDTSSGPPPRDSPSISNDKPETKTEFDLLVEAEENLIEIRSKLLSSLGELDTSFKTNAQEKEKLLNMVKKLSDLKALVVKFEDKVKTQKMKLAMSNSFTQSLYEGVLLRSKTCSKMKDLCAIAGKNIIGPQYKPPSDFEVQLEEKQKTLDFSKYVPKKAEKK